MANVVDPNSWRMVPLHDSDSSKLVRSNASPFEFADSDSPAVARLAAALKRTFGASEDRVVWHMRDAAGDQQLRIDASHDVARDYAPSDPASEIEPPWHVLVQTSQEIASETASPELRAAIEKEVRLLLVVCGVNQTDAQGASQRQLAERVAARLRLPYFEPQSPESDDELTHLLAEVKRRGSSSVLYIDTALASPESRLSPGQRPVPPPPERSYRETALTTLRELQSADARVTCLTSDSNQEDTAALLARCRSLAIAGNRPFAFISLAEALDNLPEIRRAFADGQHSINLVCEARSEQDPPASSSQLAAFRGLPGTSLLAPKDGPELSRMLTWCAGQNAPSIIWLAESLVPSVAWSSGEEIASGRAERLGEGADVALVAWGATNAAAAIAAESLAQLGIRATIVNARFAQPLDVPCIATACADAAYTIVLDDSDAGGFAAWVCEQLVRRGFAPNMTIVSPSALDSAPARDAQHSLAAAVVNRCRWLGDHFNPPVEGGVAPSERAGSACLAQSPLEPPLLITELAGTPDVQAQVLATQFSPFIAQWVDRYGRVGSRDVYLWRWCLHGLDLTRLSCVAPELRRDLCDTKLLAVMYGVMLDDVADHAGGESFLAALTGIIAGRPDRDFSAFSNEQQQYAQFTCELWDTFQSRLKRSPFYDEYAELLDYDHQQILNTFAYSLMVNKRLALLNVQEHDMYQPHNMQMMSFATMDLMCSPGFDRAELGRLREVIWHAQSMGRIGNLVSTWQREIADRDFTSGVFARALCAGDLSLDDLASAPPAQIEAAVRRGQHEQYFLRKWEAHRQSIASLAEGIRSVDIAALLRSLARLLQMELNSRGFK